MASYKYNASRDSITIRPERSKGAAIRAAAAASGKSLQNYILDAISARMEQDGRNQCQTAPAPISTGKDPPRLNQQQKRKKPE